MKRSLVLLVFACLIMYTPYTLADIHDAEEYSKIIGYETYKSHSSSRNPGQSGVGRSTSDKQRAGLDYATAVQKALGDKATVIEPQFTEQDIKEFEALYGNRPSDFNDLHKLHALEAVSTQLLSKETEIGKNTDLNNSIAPDIERIKEQI